MKKYWHVINVGIQNNLTYRFNFLARTLFGLIPLTAVLFLWRTIYSTKGANATVSSYTLAQMTFYYLLVTIVDAVTAVNEDDWQIAADIKDGNISQFLLKPVDYLWFRLCLFLAGRLTYMAVAFIPLTLFILYPRSNARSASRRFPTSSIFRSASTWARRRALNWRADSGCKSFGFCLPMA